MSWRHQGFAWKWRPLAKVLGFLWLATAVRAQPLFTDQNPSSSVSGQFLVSRTPDAEDNAPSRRPLLTANTNLIQLKTALLAVAAERFKYCLWRQLGLPANAPWSGKIYLRLHPAVSLNETVTITESPFLNFWNYGVELPDQVMPARYGRALSGVLLLEYANRTVPPGGHSAEVPAWLVDGLAQEVLAEDGERVVLSAPGKKMEPLLVNRLNHSETGFDALAAARQLLQNQPALTFDQLSWPTDDQMDGADGGLYLASAQLFQNELLELPEGRAKMRAFLAELPAHLNWQTAFFHAFGADFKRPLDVEKWWALRVVNFVQHTPGPRWTLPVSLARLQALLSVPVDYRNGSNAMPARAEISLQAALRNLSPAPRDEMLRLKVRDLALVELRLTPPFGNLADGYRNVLADFLGESTRPPQVSLTNKHATPPNHRTSLMVTLKELDALDIRRRAAESRAMLTLRQPSAAGLQ